MFQLPQNQEMANSLAISNQQNPQFAALNYSTRALNNADIQGAQMEIQQHEALNNLMAKTLGQKGQMKYANELAKGRMALQHSYNKELNQDTYLRGLQDMLMAKGLGDQDNIQDARRALSDYNFGQNKQAMIPGQSVDMSAMLPNQGQISGGINMEGIDIDLQRTYRNDLAKAYREKLNTGDDTAYNALIQQIKDKQREASRQDQSLKYNSKPLYEDPDISFINSFLPSSQERIVGVTKNMPFLQQEQAPIGENFISKYFRGARNTRNLNDQYAQHVDYLNKSGLTSVRSDANVIQDLKDRGLDAAISQLAPGSTLKDVDVATKDGSVFEIIVPSTNKKYILRKSNTGLQYLGEK